MLGSVAQWLLCFCCDAALVSACCVQAFSMRRVPGFVLARSFGFSCLRVFRNWSECFDVLSGCIGSWHHMIIWSYVDHMFDLMKDVTAVRIESLECRPVSPVRLVRFLGFWRFLAGCLACVVRFRTGASRYRLADEAPLLVRFFVAGEGLAIPAYPSLPATCV